MATVKKETAKKGDAPRPPLVFEKSAGAVVFVRAPKIEYLLICAKRWEFPKGWVEGGESEERAALREVREETGLEVELVPDFEHRIEYFYRRRESGALVKKEVVYLLGEASSREVKLSWEHSEAQWAGLEDALALVSYEQYRDILRAADERLRR